MASTVWPLLLDYNNDECRRILRKLEIEAYASVISAFRAQGEMSKDKKKMLQELSVVLSIPLERHKAEIRRAVNDEQLNTVADRLAGPNTSMEWAIEGRRVLPSIPRLVPQTAFTAFANLAADSQAAKNAAMPAPSATGYKEVGYIDDFAEEPEVKLKRASSVDLDDMPEKIFALDDCSSTGLITYDAVPMEDSTDIGLPFPSMGVPQCMLQSFAVKEGGCSNTIKKSSSMRSSTVTYGSTQKPGLVPSSSSPMPVSMSSISKSLNAGSLPLSSSNATSSKAPSSTSVMRSVSVPLATSPSSSLLPSSSPFGKHFASNTLNTAACHLAENNYMSSNDSPIEDTKSLGSVFRPLSSVSGSHPTSSSLSAANGRSSCRPKEKFLATSKTCVRPRLSAPSLIMGGSAPGLQNTQTQVSSQPVHRTVSPPKSRTQSYPRAQSPAIAISTPPVSLCQSAMNTQQQPFARITQSPAPRIPCCSTPSTANSSVSVSSLKQTSTVGSLPSSVKSSTPPKSLSKSPSVKVPYSCKPMVTPASKTSTFVSKSPATSISSVTSRVAMQPCVKMAQTAAAKTSVSITCSQKSSPQNQNKSGNNSINNTVAKTVPYRNESGLKIISQNMHTNWLVTKACSSSTPTTTTTTSRLATTNSSPVPGVTGSARIINFSQPINARFARASITSSPSTGIVSSLPNTGLRVAMPVGINNTPTMRASMPAKPNVIVVHKAQVWPQTPGATIVMTSSSPLTRISSEALEAVTLMQRQETARHMTSSHRGLSLHQPSATILSTPAPSSVAVTTTTLSAQSIFKKSLSVQPATDDDQVKKKLITI